MSYYTRLAGMRLRWLALHLRAHWHQWHVDSGVDPSHQREGRAILASMGATGVGMEIAFHRMARAAARCTGQIERFNAAAEGGS